MAFGSTGREHIVRTNYCIPQTQPHENGRFYRDGKCGNLYSSTFDRDTWYGSGGAPTGWHATSDMTWRSGTTTVTQTSSNMAISAYQFFGARVTKLTGNAVVVISFDNGTTPLIRLTLGQQCSFFLNYAQSDPHILISDSGGSAEVEWIAAF